MSGNPLGLPQSLADVSDTIAGWTNDEGTADEPRPRPSPSLDRMRADARTLVEVKSLAAVARDVGMRRASLRAFMDGGPIRGSSRGKLFRYLLRTGAEAEARARECAEMLLALVYELPPEEQIAAVVGMVAQLQGEFQDRTGKVPLWLTALGDVVAPYAPDTRPDPPPPTLRYGSGN